MISSSGENLEILIVCDYSLQNDWQTFALWYSIYKNLPDAKVSVLCSRNFIGKEACFCWPYKANIRFFQFPNLEKHYLLENLNLMTALLLALHESFVKPPLLVMQGNHICIRSLQEETLRYLNRTERAKAGNIYYFNNLEYTTNLNILNTDSQIPNLAGHASDNTFSSFVDYSKFDKFDLHEWSDKPLPPFYFCRRFALPTASVNTKRVLVLWDRMKAAYEVMK